MPFRPSEPWYTALANRASRVPVFILYVDGAPACWSSGPVRPQQVYSLPDRVTGATAKRLYQSSAVVGDTSERTFVGSVWLKAGTTRNLILQVHDDITGASSALTLTDDWVRYVVAFTQDPINLAGTAAFLSLNYPSGAPTGNYYAWGWQLEERTGKDAVATLYERTDTVLYAKNLLFASEDLGDSRWIKDSGLTVSTDQTTAPASRFDTEQTPMVVGALDVKEFTGNQIYPSEGRYAVGELLCSLINNGGLVSRWLATERPGASPVYMASAALYAGEAELREDEYEIVWSGFIDSVSCADGASYDLKGLTKLYAWDRQIMTNCASVSGSISVPDSALPQSKFRGNSDLSQVDDFYNGWSIKFSSGENENAERTVLDYVGATRTVTLSSDLPNDSADKDPFTLYNFVKIVGNPIDIYARMLLGDFATTGQVQTDFPLAAVSGVTPTGLSFAREELDIAQIQNERDTWFGGSFNPAADLFGQAMQMIWVEPEQARKFFEEQIFRVIDAYPTLSIDGSFRVKAGRPTVPGAEGVIEITDGVVDGIPKWTRLTDQIVTNVKVWGDFNPATKSYQLLAEKTTRDARYTPEAILRSETIEIKSRGLRTSLNGVGLSASRADRLLSRFGTGGPEQIIVPAGPILAFLESGERVLVSLKDLPVLFTGLVGKSRETFEVTRVRMKGNLVAEVIVVGFYPVGRPAFIGPDTMTADYASATQDDQVYAYISPATGNFADGRASYRFI